MADYYSIIAKAVGGLDPNTGAARRRLYDRARVALVAEMRSAGNALDESDILAAQASLEGAIRKIEADAEPDEDAEFANAYEAIQPPPAALPRAGVVAPRARRRTARRTTMASTGPVPWHDFGPGSSAEGGTTPLALNASRAPALRCSAISRMMPAPRDTATLG